MFLKNVTILHGVATRKRTAYSKRRLVCFVWRVNKNDGCMYQRQSCPRHSVMCIIRYKEDRGTAVGTEEIGVWPAGPRKVPTRTRSSYSERSYTKMSFHPCLLSSFLLSSLIQTSCSCGFCFVRLISVARYR